MPAVSAVAQLAIAQMPGGLVGVVYGDVFSPRIVYDGEEDRDVAVALEDRVVEVAGETRTADALLESRTIRVAAETRIVYATLEDRDVSPTEN